MPLIRIKPSSALISTRSGSIVRDSLWRTCFLLLSVAALGFVLAENCCGNDATIRGATNRSWNAGIEFWFTNPTFSEDLAFLQTEEDLLANTRIRDFQFDYDTKSTPRFWLEYQSAQAIGMRVSAWFLDSDSSNITLNPPANGFGEIGTPPLFGIDLSSVIPGDQLDAQSALKISSIEMEITRRAEFGTWELELAAGIRYAGIDQQKSWTLWNAIGDLAGTAVWNQENSGWGPTIQIASHRPIFDDFGVLETSLRTSLLSMSDEVSLLGREDLDLPTSFTTDVAFERDGWMPIIEARMGLHWTLSAIQLPSWHAGFGYETQWFSEVGTPSDPNANLSVHGLFVTLTRNW